MALGTAVALLVYSKMRLCTSWNLPAEYNCSSWSCVHFKTLFWLVKCLNYLPVYVLCILSGVEIKLKNMHYKTLIAPTHIPELNKISKEDDGISFGASVTLSMIEETLLESIHEKQGTCTCISIHSFIHNTTWPDRNVHVYIDVHVMLKYICKIVTQDTFQRWIILSLDELFYIHVLALHWYLFYFFCRISKQNVYCCGRDVAMVCRPSDQKCGSKWL